MRKRTVAQMEQIAVKAADVTRAGILDALTSGGQITYNADGTIDLSVHRASYAKMYRSQSAFRAVVDFLSRGLGSIHMRVMRRQADGSALPESDTDAQRVLDHPQDGVPYSRLMRGIVADKAIYDVAAVWKIRERFDPTPRDDYTVLNEGAVVSLVRLPIPFVTLTQSSLTAPLMFELRTGRPPLRLPARDVVWMPGYSPDSNVSGVPPVETLRQILAEEWAAGKDRENNWKNGVQGNIVFTQHGPDGLDTDSAETFKTGWRNKYGGVAAPNAREWPLLPVGIEPKELSIDAASAEYLATRNLAREECCRAFGIRPQLLGITPANFASMDMFHQMLYQDTFSPWSISIQEEFEEQYLLEFYDEDEGYFIDFNMNAKLQGSFLDQAQIGQQAVGGPWMLVDEFREKFQGLPPLPNGEGKVLIVPANSVRGGGPQANPQDAENQFSKDEQIVRLVAGKDE